MRTSDQIDQLATALAAAQGEMKNAPLNKINPHFGKKYADLSGIRDTVTPALSKNGIAVMQGTEVEEGRVIVVTRLVHKSGQWVESCYPIAIDKPQAMGSAYTYAKRYSLSAICNIAADEDDDANSAGENNPTPMASKPDPQLLKREEARKLYKQLESELVSLGTLVEVQQWEKTRELEIAKLGDWKSYMDKAIEGHVIFVTKRVFEAAE